MINLLKSLKGRSPREAASAGHGVDRSIPPAARPATLPVVRRGRLKNGNRPGDFLAAPRCGARTRCGGACRQPAMTNGRCRMHGGLSTGPRTPEGLARCRRARLTHGGYSAHVRSFRAAACAHGSRVRALIALMAGRPAGHGVDRSNSPKGQCARRVSTQTPASAPVAPSTTSSTIGVHLRSSAAQTPSFAGHGLHPSFSTPSLPAGLRAHLRSSAASMPVSAGHGVHPSFLESGAIRR
jgi:hypothetical protein